MRLVSVSANKDQFRDVRLQAGMNIVIAERNESASEGDSRNGVGKTSLLQVIDFCLGGSIRPKDPLSSLKGDGWEFRLEILDNSQRRIVVTRSLDDNKIHIDGATGGLTDLVDKNGGIGQERWKDWLGEELFGLIGKPGQPTFRQTLPHFLRFRKDAYLDPFKTTPTQRAGASDTENAFLVGISPEIMAEWKNLREDKMSLEKSGVSNEAELTRRVGALNSDHAVLSSRVRRLEESIDAFQVLPEYDELSARVNKLTQLIQDTVNSRTVNGRTIELYQTQFDEPEVDDGANIWEVFSAAGAELGDTFKRSVDEVVQFHEAVARNRRDYLRAEIERLEDEQDRLQRELIHFDEERASLLTRLRDYGALRDFLEMEKNLLSAQSELNDVDDQIRELTEARADLVALKTRETELDNITALDLQERQPSLTPILESFSETIEALYETPGRLIISAGNKGYKFDTDVDREGSSGVGLMKIFAYDWAVATGFTHRPRKPSFLAHDSAIFDGVDERQCAAALARASHLTLQTGSQYLVAINSDQIPWGDLSSQGVTREMIAGWTILTLGDSSPEQALFGMRWD